MHAHSCIQFVFNSTCSSYLLEKLQSSQEPSFSLKSNQTLFFYSWQVVCGDCQETEAHPVWACHLPRHTLQNHLPQHLGGWAKLWRAEEMLVGQHQRVDIPAIAKSAHDGLLQKRLEEDLCWLILQVPPKTQSVKGWNWTELCMATVWLKWMIILWKSVFQSKLSPHFSADPVMCRLDQSQRRNRTARMSWSMSLTVPWLGGMSGSPQGTSGQMTVLWLFWEILTGACGGRGEVQRLTCSSNIQQWWLCVCQLLWS